MDEGLGGDYPCFFWNTDAVNGPFAFWSNGSGDEYSACFWRDAALLWGFDHESSMSPWGRDDGLDEWPGMFDGLPEKFRAVLDAQPDPDWSRSVTFCYWHDGDRWHVGHPEVPDWETLDDPQGVGGVLADVLSASAAGEYVRHYHERPECAEAAVALSKAAQDGVPLTAALLAPLATAKGVEDLLRRAREVGLPVADHSTEG